ncbi:MAG: phosphoribosylanthranilate isomerase [Gammaproteobacteria bacterium]|nr:phosphoribosylanthranilate isomerase [Gammaproteobacteria bacterium]
MTVERRVRTKICGITRAEDARAAIEAGADALGFVFYQASPRYVAPHSAQEIISRIAPFPAKVGLFVDPDREFVDAVLAQVALDVLQFHGDEDPAFCSSFGKPYIKAVRMKPGIDLHTVCRRHAGAAALLLDSYSDTGHGGTGTVFDWNNIPADLTRPVILAGGLTTANVSRAIAACKPYAVDVSSGVELDKGVKDKDAITAFIREVTHA